ncbi:MAG: TetR/AcrR family transcriptional regulator [Spirochaetaceae bacterium]|nr:MAG: TetR/AcrR family transcriptional regulator [Spirochaetaceae bacterium]
MYDSEQMSDTDPRVERTRAQLAQSASQLLVSEGWEAMSVAAVCARARVSRSTFYLQFRQPWEPVVEHLTSLFRSEYPTLIEGRSALDPDSLLLNGHPLSYSFFEHVERHEDLYRRIFGHVDGAPVCRQLTARIADLSRLYHEALRAISSEPIDPDLIAGYLAGALVEVGGRWIISQPRRSATAMAYWFSQMAAPGLLQMMGLGSLLEG